MIKVRKHTHARRINRQHKKMRIRRHASAWGSIPRLVLFRSNRYLFAQVVDDSKGNTLVWAHSMEKDFSELKSKKNIEAAKKLGLCVGKRALEKKVSHIFFDRNGYAYHGRIKAFADGAREAGLRF